MASLVSGYTNRAKSGKVSVDASQAQILHGCSRNVYRQTPDTAINGLVLSSARRVLYSLGSINVIPDELYIELSLTNSSTTVTQYWNDLHSLFDGLYLWDTAQNRALTLQTQLIEQIVMTELKTDYNQHLREHTSDGTTSDQTMGSGLGFANFQLNPSTTYVAYIKVDSCFSNGISGKVPLSALANMKMEANFNAANNIFDINGAALTGGNVVLNSCDLLVYGHKINAGYEKFYMPDPKVEHQYTFFNLESIISVPLTAVSGVYQEQRLYSLNQDGVAAIVAMVRPQSVSATGNTWNFRQMSDVQIRKFGTRCVYDINGLPAIMSKVFNNELNSYWMEKFQNVVVMPFGDLSEKDLRAGILKYGPEAGILDGQCTIYYQPSETRNVQLDVFALTLKKLVIPVGGGSFRIENVFSNNS